MVVNESSVSFMALPVSQTLRLARGTVAAGHLLTSAVLGSEPYRAGAGDSSITPVPRSTYNLTLRDLSLGQRE